MSASSYQKAMQDFRHARQEAALRQLLNRLSGRSDQLLAYSDVSDQLHITDTIEHGLQEIPLKAIVGSVGRADDFTRDFLPKRDSDAERWAAVKAAVMDMKGWAPIEVYQVGDVYFVKDGNHRVSVARRLGNDSISAYVTEVETRLDLSADDDPREMIARANYLDFAARTKLEESRTGADLRLTFPNHYATLLAQIESYRLKLQQEGHTLSFAAGAAAWYDDVYLPMVDLIREQGILHEFPERTEADMYVLLSERHEELEAALGWRLRPESAVSEWAASLSTSRVPFLARLGERLRETLAPGLEEGPPVGEWRKRRAIVAGDDSLFNDILVSLQGTEADWRLLDSTLLVAQREEATVMAMHAVDEASELDNAETRAIHAEFIQRCARAGVSGQFTAEVGVEGLLLIERSRWVDLVTTNLTFATDFKAPGPLSSGVDMLIQRCPRPILVMAGDTSSPMDRALLGYDGSAKADEALFVAAYLAARWRISLTIVTVETEYTSPAVLDRARRYLIGSNLVRVNYVLGKPPILDAILETAAREQSNLIIVGGFGYRPLRHLVLGSTVDGLLAQAQIPTLICR